MNRVLAAGIFFLLALSVAQAEDPATPPGKTEADDSSLIITAGRQYQAEKGQRRDTGLQG
jgi:hypothetical protein